MSVSKIQMVIQAHIIDESGRSPLNGLLRWM